MYSPTTSPYGYSSFLKEENRKVQASIELTLNMTKETRVEHFRFQGCLQQKTPMKRGFFKELKAVYNTGLLILIFVFHHSLMLLREGTFNSSVCLCHGCLDIFHAFSFGRNRVVNSQNHAMAMYPFACAWEDFK